MVCEIVLLPFLAMFYVVGSPCSSLWSCRQEPRFLSLAAMIQVLDVHARTLKATIRQRLQPREDELSAGRQYFYSVGWAEFRNSVQRTHVHAQGECRHWLNQAAELAEGSSKTVELPLAAGLVVAVVAGAIAAYALFGVLVLLHAIAPRSASRSQASSSAFAAAPSCWR